MRRLAVLLATGLGIGYLPIAPATWASAATAIPLAFLLPHLGLVTYVLATAVVTALALLVCGPAEKVLGHDAHPIVMDEVAGMMVTMIAAPTLGSTAWTLLAGFVLFRVFDIGKPPPVDRAQNLPGAYGIVMDDLLAGVYANLVLQLAGMLWRR